MNEIVNTYIRTNNIDSFQKLRFLLFLHQHPHLKATSQEFANRASRRPRSKSPTKGAAGLQHIINKSRFIDVGFVNVLPM